jgi:hypothetical protein
VDSSLRLKLPSDMFTTPTVFAGKKLPPITPPQLMSKPKHHKAKAAPKHKAVSDPPSRTPYFDYRGGLLRVCGGTTPKGKAGWKSYKSGAMTGLTLHVNVKMACQFNSLRRAQFFSSLVQIGRPAAGEGFAASELSGTNYVFNSTQESFNVFVFHPLVENQVHLNHAKKHWQLSWVGAVGFRTGHTELHNTGWKAHGPNAITTHVDTGDGHFASTPRYIAGFCSQWFPGLPVMGTRSVYSATPTGFRIYIHTKGDPITPEEASKQGWIINWIGAEAKEDWIGMSSANWKRDHGSNVGAHAIVKTDSVGAILPSYVASIQSSKMKWYEGDIGAGTLFGVNPNEFSIYIDQVQPSYLRTWNVTYMGFQKPVDCKLSDWSTWGECSATCGTGQARKVRRVLVAPNHFGKQCQKVILTKPCNTKPCAKKCILSPWSEWKPCSGGDCLQYVASRHRKVLQIGRHCPPDLVQHRHHGFGKSKQCGATVNDVHWKAGSRKSNSIFSDIDTSYCSFDEYPFYVATLAVNSPVVSISTGTTSIARANRNGFRLYVYFPRKSASLMVEEARRTRWTVNWIADTGSNAGMTVPTKTGWTPFGTRSLQVQVNTSACLFKRMPRYIVAAHTNNQALRAQGSHTVHSPTAQGFGVLVRFPLYSHILAFQAEADLIAVIVWIGSTEIPPRSLTNKWQAYERDPSLSYTEVSAFPINSPKNTPCYVVTLATQQPMNEIASVFGGAGITDPDTSGFRIYVGPRARGTSSGKLSRNQWSVNYITFRGMKCQVSRWLPWTPCSSTCSGTKRRHRTVIVRHDGCPPLTETSPCGVPTCPVDCGMTKFGDWSKCSMQCGKGTHERTRSMVRAPLFGGKRCPSMKDHKVCEITPCLVTAKSAFGLVVLAAGLIGAAAAGFGSLFSMLSGSAGRSSHNEGQAQVGAQQSGQPAQAECKPQKKQQRQGNYGSSEEL